MFFLAVLAFFINSLPLAANPGAGATSQAGSHGAAHGHGTGHQQESTTSSHGASQGHGEEKKNYPAYSQSGSEKCKVPKAHKRQNAPRCGTKEYEAYIRAVEEYNACVEPYDNKIFLPLRSCQPKPKKKARPEPDYRKLLDPPG